MKNTPLVLVEWLDSHSTSGWTREEPATEPLRCQTVGWLTHDGLEAITITQNITLEDNTQRSNEMTIPLAAIEHIQHLKDARTPPKKRTARK